MIFFDYANFNNVCQLASMLLFELSLFHFEKVTGGVRLDLSQICTC